VLVASPWVPACRRSSQNDVLQHGVSTGVPVATTVAGAAGLPTPEAMARELLAAPRADVPALALDWHARGAGPEDLLRVALVAGVAEIDPSPIGGKVHAIMMVASALDLTDRLEGPTTLVPALFNLDRIKHSQARDQSDGDFTMPSAPEIEPASAQVHAEAFDRAMERWDQPAADRAVIGMHATMEPAAVFERVWPWAARDFRVIGHKAIYAAQTQRALERLGWSHGRDALRSLVLGVLDANPYDAATEAETAEILALHDHSRELAARLPEGWEAGSTDHAASLRLCARLRDCDPAAAAVAVVEAARSGVAAAAVWDGLRLRAFELLMRTPSIPGVHPVTSVNALHRAASLSRVATTRKLLALQAASWLSLFEPVLDTRGGRGSRQTIDALATAATRSERADDPFATDDPEEASRRAFVRVRERGPAGFGPGGVAVLLRKAKEDHDYKLAAAMLEELELADPGIRPYLAAAGRWFWPSARDDDGSVYEAIREPLGLA